jgi:hypothetical protein
VDGVSYMITRQRSPEPWSLSSSVSSWDLLGDVGGTFDKLSLVERGARADERDQVRAVDRSPPILGGLQQLEGYRQPSGAAARAFGHPGAQQHCRERGLD